MVQKINVKNFEIYRHWVKKIKIFFLSFSPHGKKNPEKDFLGFGMFHLAKSGSLALAGSWGGAKKIKCLKYDFLGENKLGAGEARWKVAGEETPRRPTGLPSLPFQKTLQRRDCTIRPRGAQGLSVSRCHFLVFQSCFWVLNIPMFLLSRTRTQAPLCSSCLSGSLVASSNHRDFTEDHFYLQNV